MSATYAYTIHSLKTATVENVANAVTLVRYTITATDSGETLTHDAEQQLPAPNPEDYIPFAELTEADVTGWLDGMANIMALKSMMQTRLNAMIEEAAWTTQIPPWATE